jgi:hypothetical protein
MTDPNDPTAPDPTDPTAELVRDALAARAEGVHPLMDDPTHLSAAIEADQAARKRKRTAVAGLGAAAAILLVVVGVALTSGSDDAGQVTTGSDPSTTATDAPSTTDASAATTTSTGPTTTEAPVTSTSIAPATTAPPATAPPTTAPILPGSSTDPRSGPSSGPLPALLTDLRLGCQGPASRVALEFADGAMPEWSVEYVDPPIIEDASGETVAIRGNAFLQVRLTPAWGHDLDQPDAPATYTGPKRLSGGCGSSLEVVNTGEFEAVYTWVIGLPAPVPFTVSTLGSPSRLVIDLAG